MVMQENALDLRRYIPKYLISSTNCIHIYMEKENVIKQM